MRRQHKDLPLEQLLEALDPDLRTEIDGITNGTLETKNVRKAKRQSCLRILDGADIEAEIAALRIRVDELLAAIRENPEGYEKQLRAAQKAREFDRWERVHRSSPVWRTYLGSDGAAPRNLLTQLRSAGPFGVIAAGLFKAQKASSRAKRYRGGIEGSDGETVSYSELSYQRMQEGIDEVCNQLRLESCGLNWGWGEDRQIGSHPYVLIVDLPQGQVSFCSSIKIDGPYYGDTWDGTNLSERRIIEFCEEIHEFVQDGTDQASAIRVAGSN